MDGRRIPADRDDWLSPHLQWITGSSWLMSGVMHLAAVGLLVIVSRMSGCQPDLQGEGGDALREVGLYQRPAATVAAADSVSEDAADPAAESSASNAAPATEPVLDQPPIPLQLPAVAAPPVLGVGGPPQSAAGLDQLLSPGGRPGTSAPAGSGGGDRPGTTSFLGIKDAGRRFVYVIDASSSMADYGAFRVAKSELLASVERLTETQQFQVVFCNSADARTLDAGRLGTFFGTDAQRLEVRLQIAGVGVDAGTDHKRAVLTALELNPDVVFYLSDGGEPFLTARDLDEIKRRNRGSRIHCIEFGRGPISLHDGQPVTNFLTRLAAQNDGQYAYRDVTQFLGR